MSLYSGFISIYSTNDAYITILMSNLAGTTLSNIHLVFNENHAEKALMKTFNLAPLH
jgi:hypothetical protein